MLQLIKKVFFHEIILLIYNSLKLLILDQSLIFDNYIFSTQPFLIIQDY